MIRIHDPRRIGGVIHDLRAMNLLTQRELCEQTGLEQARLSEWENGRAVPTLRHLVPTLECLGFDLALVPAGGRPTGTGWPA